MRGEKPPSHTMVMLQKDDAIGDLDNLCGSDNALSLTLGTLGSSTHGIQSLGSGPRPVALLAGVTGHRMSLVSLMRKKPRVAGVPRSVLSGALWSFPDCGWL